MYMYIYLGIFILLGGFLISFCIYVINTQSNRSNRSDYLPIPEKEPDDKLINTNKNKLIIDLLDDNEYDIVDID